MFGPTVLPALTAGVIDVAGGLGWDRDALMRLVDERTRFTNLVTTHGERAVLLLEDPHLGSWEVAFLLGYGEPAAFFRAFRRWTGTSA